MWKTAPTDGSFLSTAVDFYSSGAAIFGIACIVLLVVAHVMHLKIPGRASTEL